MEKFYAGEGGGRTDENFDSKLVNARLLLGYLEAKGLNARKSRVGRYVDFYEAYLAGKCEEQETRDKLLFVMREMDEWGWIYRGLQRGEPEGFLELIEVALGGPAFAKDEAENTRPRNIQLELRIGSYFLQAGYAVSFAGLEDLVVNVRGFPVFVECKRIGSRKQVQKRAKESIKQLKRRYASIKGVSYGLVVLDVSRVIHPEQGLAIGVNELVARDGIRAQLSQLDQESDTSPIFAKDKHLISVWQQAIVPTIHEKEECLATRFSSLHSIYAKQGQRKWDLFEALKPAFEVI
jgi:hypothetical protein